MKTYLIILLLFPLLGACEENEKKSAESSKVGRYQIIQAGTMRRDQYLIDTETGNMWTRTCAVPAGNVDCSYSYWSKEDIVGINTTAVGVAAVADLYRDKKSK